MLTRLQIKKICFAWLLLMWSFATLAAQQTSVHDINEISVVDLALSLLLAIIGGGAHTATRIADVDVVLKSVTLEVIKDVLTSIVIGLLIFFAGLYYQWPVPMRCGLITLASYGGSRVLEPALATFIQWIGRLGVKPQ